MEVPMYNTANIKSNWNTSGIYNYSDLWKNECTTCEHNKVCKYMDKFECVKEQAGKIETEMENGESFINIRAECVYYMNHGYIPKYPETSTFSPSTGVDYSDFVPYSTCDSSETAGENTTLWN